MGITIPPSEFAQESSRLTLTRIAAETISALSLVRITESDEFVLADQANFDTALAVGFALNGGLAGTSIEIVTFGIIEDPFFTFSVNDDLFLGTNGQVQSTIPINHRTRVGNSLGSGSIFVRIEEPIIL